MVRSILSDEETRSTCRLRQGLAKHLYRASDLGDSPLSACSRQGQKIYKEDVDIRLAFPAPDTGENPRKCALLDQLRTAQYKLGIDGESVQEEHFVSQLARNRVATVRDFLTNPTARA